MRAEAERLLGNRRPTFADVAQMNVARMVIEESMRLYPPIWAVARQVVADVVARHRLEVVALRGRVRTLPVGAFGQERVPDDAPEREAAQVGAVGNHVECSFGLGGELSAARISPDDYGKAVNQIRGFR